MTSLVEQQRHRVFHLTDLTLEVGLLCLHAIVVGLGRLHTGRAGTAQLHLQLHHVPGVLGESFHIGDNSQLFVEHHQRIVEVGHTTDNLCLHSHLIILCCQQFHLCRALLREQVAKEVNVPRSADRQLIGLADRGAVHLHLTDGALGRKSHRGQEGQFGTGQCRLHHLHVEGSIAQVNIILKSGLNESLQLRVSKHLAPGQIAKVLVGIHSQGVAIALQVANQSLGIQILRTLVFVVESAAGQHQAEQQTHPQAPPYMEGSGRLFL